MAKSLVAWLLMAATAAASTRPSEVVQSAVSRAMTIVQDSNLARPANADRRRAALRRAAEDLFDYGEMARRTLVRHWADRSAEERQEFVRLFTRLLERSYLGKIQDWAGERVVYLGEAVDGDRAEVRSKIVTARRREIPIEYRLHRSGVHWQVYDVLFEGASVVSVYRSQFNRIIQESSFAALIDRMRQKEAEFVGAGGRLAKTF